MVYNLEGGAKFSSLMIIARPPVARPPRVAAALPTPACRSPLATPVLRVSKLGFCCNRDRVLQSIDVAIPGKRVIYLVNHGNINGAALLGGVVNILQPHANRVQFRKRKIGDLSPSHHTHVKVNCIPRNHRIVPQLAIQRGLLVNRRTLNDHNGPIGSMPTRVCRLFPILRAVLSHVKNSLDNKRRRRLTVTHTVVNHPGLLILSRPARNVRPSVVLSVRTTIGGVVRAAKVSILLMRRRLRFIHRTSCCCTVRQNAVITGNPAHRLAGSIVRRFLTI